MLEVELVKTGRDTLDGVSWMCFICKLRIPKFAQPAY
jgi:hypothetical protein